MFISDDLYRQILQSMPIPCIDVLVKNTKGQYLLIKRKHEPLKDIFWTPGGRINKNETLETALRRIVKLELNSEVKTLKAVGYFEDFFEKSKLQISNGFHVLSFAYLVTLENENIILDNTSFEWGWFDKLPERYKQYKLVKEEQ